MNSVDNITVLGMILLKRLKHILQQFSAYMYFLRERNSY